MAGSETKRPQQGRAVQDSQLSDSETAAIEYAKQLHDEEKHRKWLWGVIGKAAKWVAALVGFITLVADAAQRLWKTFHG